MGRTLGIKLSFAFALVAIASAVPTVVNLPGALVTFGGAFAVLFITFPAKQVLGAFGAVKNCFFIRLREPQEQIRLLADLAAMTRRDGMLALEKKLAEIDDSFTVRGLEMVIDGTHKEKLEKVLTVEVESVQARYGSGKQIFEQLGHLLPAFGLVACLVGLVHMMQDPDDPGRVGAGVAVALMGTFYGLLAANLVFLPLADKLDARGKEAVSLCELTIHGLAALVQGESPLALESKLQALLAPKERQAASYPPPKVHEVPAAA